MPQVLETLKNKAPFLLKEQGNGLTALAIYILPLLMSVYSIAKRSHAYNSAGAEPLLMP